MAQRTAPKTTAGEERRRRRFEERDQRIRDESVRLFLDRGLDGFTAADVAHAIDYSKGTFYHHYTSKEDALLEVLLRHGRDLAERFELAAASPGGTRARIAVMLELNVRRTVSHPEYQALSTVFLAQSSLSRASTERQQAFVAVTARENAVLAGLAREAISRGDLTLPDGIHPTWATFALSSMSYGSLAMVTGGEARKKYTLDQVRPVLSYVFEVALDGLGWKPVGGDATYRADAARLHTRLFPAEEGS